MTRKEEREIRAQARRLIRGAEFALTRLEAQYAKAMMRGHTLRARALADQVADARVALEIGQARYSQTMAKLEGFA